MCCAVFKHRFRDLGSRAFSSQPLTVRVIPLRARARLRTYVTLSFCVAHVMLGVFVSFLVRTRFCHFAAFVQCSHTHMMSIGERFQ